MEVYMTTLRKLLTATALSLMLLQVGSAQGQAQGPKKNPCTADLEKFCSKVEKGGKQRFECLKEHENELSPDCKTAFDKLMKAAEERKAAPPKKAARRQDGRRGGMRQLCKEEVNKYCKDYIGKRQEMVNCLKKHEADLSDQCKQKVEQVLKQIEKGKAAKKPAKKEG